MVERLHLKILSNASQLSLFTGLGAGGSYLLSDGPEKTIEIVRFDDTGRVVTDYKSKGSWVYEQKFPNRKFKVKCSFLNGKETCERSIMTKNRSGEIKVFVGEIPEDQRNESRGNYDDYKFTYKSTMENEIDGYLGECSKNNIEGDENACSDKNLPEGWSKEKVVK